MASAPSLDDEQDKGEGCFNCRRRDGPSVELRSFRCSRCTGRAGCIYLLCEVCLGTWECRHCGHKADEGDVCTVAESEPPTPRNNGDRAGEGDVCTVAESEPQTPRNNDDGDGRGRWLRPIVVISLVKGQTAKRTWQKTKSFSEFLARKMGETRCLSSIDLVLIPPHLTVYAEVLNRGLLPRGRRRSTDQHRTAGCRSLMACIRLSQKRER